MANTQGDELVPIVRTENGEWRVLKLDTDLLQAPTIGTSTAALHCILGVPSPQTWPNDLRICVMIRCLQGWIKLSLSISYWTPRLK